MMITKVVLEGKMIKQITIWFILLILFGNSSIEKYNGIQEKSRIMEIVVLEYYPIYFNVLPNTHKQITNQNEIQGLITIINAAELVNDKTEIVGLGQETDFTFTLTFPNSELNEISLLYILIKPEGIYITDLIQLDTKNNEFSLYKIRDESTQLFLKYIQ